MVLAGNPVRGDASDVNHTRGVARFTARGPRANYERMTMSQADTPAVPADYADAVEEDPEGPQPPSPADYLNERLQYSAIYRTTAAKLYQEAITLQLQMANAAGAFWPGEERHMEDVINSLMAGCDRLEALARQIPSRTAEG